MILTRCNLVSMKMYTQYIFDSMSKPNILLGRFANPDVFYVPHFDTQVKIDKWTSVSGTTSVQNLPLFGSRDNAIIYTTDS